MSQRPLPHPRGRRWGMTPRAINESDSPGSQTPRRQRPKATQSTSENPTQLLRQSNTRTLVLNVLLCPLLGSVVLLGGIASTDARKSLLIDFADLRGSTAMAMGAIRAYLLTADGAFKTEFAELWALNQKKFDALEKRRSEMTVDQQKAIDASASEPAPSLRRCRRRCSISALRIAGTWRNGS